MGIRQGEGFADAGAVSNSAKAARRRGGEAARAREQGGVHAVAPPWHLQNLRLCVNHGYNARRLLVHDEDLHARDIASHAADIIAHRLDARNAGALR